MSNRDVTPDESLLKEIFGIDQPDSISIFVQDWDKCVFKAEFFDNTEGLFPTCVVRLEAVDDNAETFTMVAALQQLAADAIPDLVPRISRIGKAKNDQGRIFHFSVIELVEGDLLQDVWQLLSAENQRSVAAEIAAALEKLHSVRPNDRKVMDLGRSFCQDVDEVLRGFEREGGFGGPHTGYLQNGTAFLTSIMAGRELREPFYTVEPTVNLEGFSIRSNFDGLGSVVINEADIDKLPEEAVLCHNDLNPRNLILQLNTTENKYKLAGILDWELAGFYPASYELSLQDTYLSTANQHTSFYLLLKEHMTKIIPRSSSQTALVQAMGLIYESQQRWLLEHNNIPAQIRKKFMEYEKLVRDSDPYVGWTRVLQDGPFPAYSRAVFQKLEDDVVEAVLEQRGRKVNEG